MPPKNNLNGVHQKHHPQSHTKQTHGKGYEIVLPLTASFKIKLLQTMLQSCVSQYTQICPTGCTLKCFHWNIIKHFVFTIYKTWRHLNQNVWSTTYVFTYWYCLPPLNIDDNVNMIVSLNFTTISKIFQAWHKPNLALCSKLGLFITVLNVFSNY